VDGESPFQRGTGGFCVVCRSQRGGKLFPSRHSRAQQPIGPSLRVGRRGLRAVAVAAVAFELALAPFPPILFTIEGNETLGAAKAASFNGSVSEMTAITSNDFAGASGAVISDTLLTCSQE
jgi:hypothetical protein